MPVSNTLGDSVIGSATTVVIVFGGLVRTLIFLAPWLLLGGLAWFGWRRFGPRWPTTINPVEPQETAAI